MKLFYLKVDLYRTRSGKSSVFFLFLSILFVYIPTSADEEEGSGDREVEDE